MSQDFFYPPGSSNVVNVSLDSEGPTGAPIPGDAILVGGEDPSGNLQALQTDASGALLVNIAGGTGPDDINIAQYGGVATTLGQKVSATSMPVVLSTEQQAILAAGATAANQALEIAAINAVEAAVVSNEAVLQTFSDKTAGALVPEAFDYQDITYVGATTNIDQVVYKLGGSGGAIVATLTMGYDGSQRLNSVTRS